jgi:hypothetical protein
MRTIPASSIGRATFRSTFRQMIPSQTLRSLTERFQPQRGAPPVLPTPDLIESLVYHPLPTAGTLAAHLADLGGPPLRDASLAERRQRLDPRLFEKILATALHPLADPRAHPDAFYRGLRLLGIDGVQFSLRNTEPIRAQTIKARTRRGRAAFAKLGLCVISELGLHNPVVAATGLESERVLARRCMPYLPRRSLLLGDRYYGVGCCIAECIPLCRERGSEYLFRVRANLKAEPVRPLADGSAVMRVTLADGATIEVREIRGRIRTREGARTAVRLWTSLMPARRYPARQLLRLYARRWEQEVATDELKNRLHGGALLQSQTVRTAVQELAALVLAQALVARVRTAAARRGRVPTLRVSFGKTLQMLQLLWPVLEVSDGLLSRRQQRELIRRLEQRLLRQLTGPRRERTYPRAVRQPVTKWPRLRHNRYHQGSVEVEITRIKK